VHGLVVVDVRGPVTVIRISRAVQRQECSTTSSEMQRSDPSSFRAAPLYSRALDGYCRSLYGFLAVDLPDHPLAIIAARIALPEPSPITIPNHSSMHNLHQTHEPAFLNRRQRQEGLEMDSGLPAS
jgi:hypothetical protein